jgi:hypothetical protein
MFLGIGLALLLLPGGPAATATPPDGYLAEYPIYVLDEWDMGGGGGSGKLKNCQKKGPDDKKLYWVTYDVLGVHTGKTKKMSESDAIFWIREHCENP